MTEPQRAGLTLLAEASPAAVVSARGNGHGFISTRVARTLVEMGYASTSAEISFTITPAGLVRHAVELIHIGSWRRAAGDAACETCGLELRLHTDVPAYPTFRVLCGGEVVKL